MRRVCALLRAVNVGGQGKVVMSELRALLADLGYGDPQTLLASGNAVFATDETAGEIERRLSAGIRETMGVSTDVLARDHAELAAVMAANPFAAFAQTHPNRMMALFLSGPAPADLEAAVRGREEEQVAAGPRCLYIAYPQGAGTSRLRIAGAHGTARNWNTVGKLAQLTA